MNINQLPNSFEGIAATYIPQVDDRTQFMKDVEYNMKVLSGLNPSISKDEITEQTNLQYEEDHDVGTEKALLNVNDPEIIRSLGEQMFTHGMMNKNNNSISLMDYYSGSVLADNLSDDVLRINVSNTEEDIPQYMTKYNYLQLKIAEAMNNLEPNVTRMAARFIGQPALGMGLPIAGAKIGTGLGGPVGAAIGYGIGSFASHGVGQAWDVGVLGDTIYNTELELNNMMRDTLTTNADFATAVDEYIEYLKTIPPEYQYEAYKSLLEGPDPFADAGGPFTGLGLSTSIKPIRGALNIISPILPRFRGNMLKRAELNQEIVKKIQDFKKNEVVKEDVDANIASKVIEQHGQGTSPEVVDTIIGIEQNKAQDSLMLRNSNEDNAFFDSPALKSEAVAEVEKSISSVTPENKSIMSEADIEKEWEVYYEDRAPEEIRKAWFNADSYGRYQAKIDSGMSEKRATLEVLTEDIMYDSNKLNADERVVPPKKKTHSNERGEIRWGEPEQNVRILHGRGTGDEPMTYEEAQKLLSKLTGIQGNLSVHSRPGTIPFNPSIENDFVSVESASPVRWGDDTTPGKWAYKERQGSGEGGEYFLAGGYASLENQEKSAARNWYLKRAKENEGDFINRIVEEYTPRVKTNEEFDGLLVSLFESINDWRTRRDLLIGTQLWWNKFKLAGGNSDDFKSITKYSGVGDISFGRATTDYVLDRFINKKISEEQTLKELEKNYNDDVKAFISKYKKVKKMSSDIDVNFNQVVERWGDMINSHNEYDSELAYTAEDLLGTFRDVIDSSYMYQFVKNIEDNLDKIQLHKGYLTSTGVKNPLKDPTGHLFYLPETGIIPLAELFDPAKTPAEHLDALMKIKNQEATRFVSIFEDIVKSFDKNEKRFSKFKDRNEFVEYMYEKFKDRFKNINDFRKALSYMYPKNTGKAINFYADRNYNRWENEYLKNKGYKVNWHNGGGSGSLNAVIIDFDEVTPATKDFTPYDNTATSFNNGHVIVKSVDGKGYYVLETHIKSGDSPVIYKNGEIVKW